MKIFVFFLSCTTFYVTTLLFFQVVLVRKGNFPPGLTWMEWCQTATFAPSLQSFDNFFHQSSGFDSSGYFLFFLKGVFLLKMQATNWCLIRFTIGFIILSFPTATFSPLSPMWDDIFSCSTFKLTPFLLKWYLTEGTFSTGLTRCFSQSTVSPQPARQGLAWSVNFIHQMAFNPAMWSTGNDYRGRGLRDALLSAKTHNISDIILQKPFCEFEKWWSNSVCSVWKYFVSSSRFFF